MKVQNLKEDFLCQTKILSAIEMLEIISFQISYYRLKRQVLPLGNGVCCTKIICKKNKKLVFTTLLTQGKLYQHCADVENQACDMFDTLVEQMKNSEGITEQLKEENQMEWICRMQNIEARSMKIVITELIYN